MILHEVLQIIIPIAHAQEAANPSAATVLGINWKLFVAQLINFALVLAILWKFAFIPVAKKLEERTAKIEKSMSDADRITSEKKEFEIWRQAEMGKARTEASSIITQAQADANKQRELINAQTKDEQNKIVEQAKKQIEQEKNKALSDAQNELADLVTNATEKILREKLTDAKDKSLIQKTLETLKA